MAALFATLSPAGAQDNNVGGVPLVVAGQPRAVIVTSAEDALSAQTAARLAQYLQEHAGAAIPVIAPAELARRAGETLIVLDGAPDQPLLRRLGISLDVPEDRADAFHVQVRRQNGRAIVAVAGRSATGVKFGAYRLMEEMDLDRGSATVPPLNIVESPFFKTRSISLFNIWRVPVDVIRQCNLESWPADKVALNLDMYDRFGFNAVETHDRFHEDFLRNVYGISRAEWREKVYAMAKRARENRMTVFLRQWGNSVALPVKKIEGGFTPFGYVNLAPDIPAERRRWEIEIRDYITKHYANHIDHLIGHWADAGGVHENSKATIADAMRLHNELQAAFRAINPKIETSFNLWNMENPRGHRSWPGYVNHRTLTTSGILERDVIIAQYTRARSRLYSEEVTAEILADGYRAAVWSWRRGDTEVRLGDPGLRIRIHGVMSDYFGGMPESARQLEWHNIERNHHGIGIDVNFFVASRLMWNPKADVDAALRKYCALVFGKDNVDAVAEAFRVIEASRDVENQVHEDILVDPIRAAKRAREVSAGLARVRLPADHRPRLPSVTPPNQILTELRGTLAAIAENADVVAEQLPALDAMRRARDSAGAGRLATQLEKKAEAWAGTITGGVEGIWLKEWLRNTAKASAAGAYVPVRGFHTSNVVLFDRSNAQFILRGEGTTPATALLELQPPARRRAEFHFQAHPAKLGVSRNVGFAFGPALSPGELVRCQLLVGENTLSIRGDLLAGPPAAVEGPKLEAAESVDCTITVDLDAQRVTFKAGGRSVEAALAGSMRSVRYYGYVVENTQTRFGPIEVRYAE